MLEPDGCPWDREQTYGTLRRHVLEEAAEVAQAIDEQDRPELCEELGDLLMHVAFLSELGLREGAFGPDDVVAGIVDKLVRRHPHVFGAAEAAGTSQVLRNWEEIKAAERKHKGKAQGMLASIPRSMPALAQAQRVTEKVARVGFDWPSATGPRAKVTEELAELDDAIARRAGHDAAQTAAVEEELGDLLLAVVNLARHVGVDAEAALNKSLAKFARRFSGVETRVEREHGGWPDGESLPIEVLDRYWNAAKQASATDSEKEPEGRGPGGGGSRA